MARHYITAAHIRCGREVEAKPTKINEKKMERGKKERPQPRAEPERAEPGRGGRASAERGKKHKPAQSPREESNTKHNK